MATESKKRRERRAKLAKSGRTGNDSAIPAAPDPGGKGAASTDTGLSPRTENQLIGQMMRADRAAWPITPQIEQAAIAVTVRHLTSDSPRVQGIAVRNLLTMKSQNMEQARRDAGETPTPATQINITQIVNQAIASVPSRRRRDQYAIADALDRQADLLELQEQAAACPVR